MKTKELVCTIKEIAHDLCLCLFFPRQSVIEIEGQSMEEFAAECTEHEAAIFMQHQHIPEDDQHLLEDKPAHSGKSFMIFFTLLFAVLFIS